MASCDPPFDDEDLIGDYYDDDDDNYGPPQEFEDDYEDEIDRQGVEISGVEQRQETSQAVPGKKQQTTIPPVITFDTVTSKTKLNKDVKGVDAKLIQDKKLYSFDRYNGSQWRKRPSLFSDKRQDIIDSSEWNRRLHHKSTLIEGDINMNVCPEAQIVEFLRRFGCSKNFIHRKAKSSRFLLDDDFPVEGSESTPMRIGESREVFINRYTKNVLHNRIAQPSRLKKNDDTGILGVSISELNRRAEELDRKLERQKLETANRPYNCINSKPIIKTPLDNHLWVDKYAPIHFTDLLSHERVNREVLRSLRQWDPYVFNKEPPKGPVASTLYKHRGREMEDTKNNADSLDKKDIRPDEQNRVILLSGPPGVGKTTLAHIVAKHAGYRPLEVNASDERSAPVLKERISRAMDSSTLDFGIINKKKQGGFGRPNCLILDEIDGADSKSSIAALVDIIRADIPTTGSKNKRSYLRRPIILICNHKFATSLRNLLPYAKTFDVLPPSPDRLISRLKAILSSENMSIADGNGLLRQLVSSAGGDIRSCMHTLQFVASRALEITSQEVIEDKLTMERKYSVIDISRVLSVSLSGKGKGLKDHRSDMISTLSAIFQKTKKTKGLGKKADARGRGDVHKILHAVECFGDNSKALDSLFLNLCNVSYVDPTLDKCWSAYEWISGADIYRSSKLTVGLSDEGALRWMQKQYIPVAAAAVHFLCRIETKPDLQFSLREMTDIAYSTDANNGIINKFLEALPPRVKENLSGSNFTTGSLPYLLQLVSKDTDSNALNNPVSSIELLSKDDRAIFYSHVARLRSLGLTYVKSVNYADSNDNTYGNNESYYRLEPEIDKLLEYKGFKSTVHQNIANIPPILKELLAHAAHLEDMREKEQSANTANDLLTSSRRKREKVKDERVFPKKCTGGDPFSKLDVKANFLGLGALKAKAARTKRKAAQVSGFNKLKKRMKRSYTGTGVSLDHVIKFRYQKGFTQAVRQPCRKNDVMWV